MDRLPFMLDEAGFNEVNTGTAGHSCTNKNLKGTVSRKITGVKSVSIDRSPFKLFPQKISQIYIQPPSCFLLKTPQRHIIECCVFFSLNTHTPQNLSSVKPIYVIHILPKTGMTQ